MADEDPTTKPTLETLLDMLREVRDEGRAFHEEVRTILFAINRQLAGFEAQLNSIKRQLVVLSGDTVQLRADMGDAQKRIERLEGEKPAG